MYFLSRCKNLQLFFCLVVFGVIFSGQIAQAQDTKPVLEPINSQKGKAPVIIIPGLIGSELINKKTNETVWFKLTKT